MSAPVPNTPAPGRPRRRGASLILPGLVVVVALGVGLIGGVVIGRHQGTTAAGPSGSTEQYGNHAGAGIGAGPAGTGRGGAVSGTIASVSGSTLTLTTASGSTETVTVPSSARVSKTATSSLSALSKGEHVTVIGTPSGSSRITARDVTEGTGFGRGLRTKAKATNG